MRKGGGYWRDSGVFILLIGGVLRRDIRYSISSLILRYGVTLFDSYQPRRASPCVVSSASIADPLSVINDLGNLRFINAWINP
ncbi:hypothetical protein DespoDRAFT_03584 [Desulfobacter postgatei 2ac9]|uniref:Uncharacterized protein n=1 Tax=Desulfobacter postgatei 2ac9 TaxID=879212 RepID=I5B776_9BACT|nr:hypothetical protein DespoDRAFT_03584 [Desulfobacter postgatei 2ac9]